MDAVKAFNLELSSLYEVKPPISKAKMTALTRGAIKGIKFYKHVVQSVEKFILKCKPEYKVPGLYVIDSIVRQSRHQFGTDKDVFAPRFAKNMQQTFANLYNCLIEDKSKIIRVLNLWQKNQVFAPDVIQPLFDLADPNHPIHKEVASASTQNNGTSTSQNSSIIKGSPAIQKTPTKTSGNELNTQSQIGNNPTNLDPNMLAQLQQLHRMLMRGENSQKSEGQPVHFDRKLLDFDYGSDEDDDPNNTSPKTANPTNTGLDTFGSILSNPEVLRQLQTLQQTMTQSVHSDYDLEQLRRLQEMKQQEDEFDKHLAQTVPNLPFAAECEFKPSNINSPAVPNYYLPHDLTQPPPGYKAPQSYEVAHQQDESMVESEVEFVSANDNDVEIVDVDRGDSRSPSRDRYNRRRRSRSRDRSRDRNRRSRRSRSRSRSRTRRHRTRSRDRRERDKESEKDKEREKERRKRGLPPIKKDNLSVCSTTLWVGHLSKLVHQEDLSDTFGEFGEIVSIDLIIPRGCAFIVMNRRQDAARCLAKLKNHKMQGKAITLAWAPGKGVKGKELKDYWEGDLGVSYIPYAKVKPDIDMEMLEDGGMIDEDTLPTWIKDRMNQSIPKKEVAEVPSISSASTSFIHLSESTSVVDTSQPPPIPTTSLLQAPPMSLPMVSPFTLNNRLLGMPPGMMSNVPMVPPPNLQPSIMPNQLLGMGSPFGQGLLHPPIPQMPPPIEKRESMSMSSIPPPTGHPPALPLSEQLINFNLAPPQPPPLTMSSNQEENMDIEMEDAERDIKKNDSFEKSSSRISRHDDRRDRNRSRDRDNRDRDRRTRRDSHDHRDREDRRDRDSSREDRGGRRERNNRWGDRKDRESREPSRDDRRDREKALNDRLREMAGDVSFREDKEIMPLVILDDTFSPEKPERFNRRLLDDFPEHGPPLNFEPPPPLLEFPPMNFPGAPGEFESMDFKGPRLNFEPPEFEDRRLDYEGPPLDYNGPPEDFEPPPIFEGPRHINFEEPMRNPRDFEGPPLDFDGPSIDFDGPRDFDGPSMDFDGLPGFGGPIRPHMRGGMPRNDRRGPPDFFGPRDGFGPRGGHRFRGPRPDNFGPRGPMMRPPMFHPRGPPHMRGPRPGLWMEGGMRPPHFTPHFDGPPQEFFRGPPNFEDGPPRGRRRFRPDFEQETENVPEVERNEKRSRWSNKSPQKETIEFPEENKQISSEEFSTTSNNTGNTGDEENENEEKVEGNTTPLHDEPQEPNVSKTNIEDTSEKTVNESEPIPES